MPFTEFDTCQVIHIGRASNTRRPWSTRNAAILEPAGQGAQTARSFSASGRASKNLNLVAETRPRSVLLLRDLARGPSGQVQAGKRELPHAQQRFAGNLRPPASTRPQPIGIVRRGRKDAIAPPACGRRAGLIFVAVRQTALGNRINVAQVDLGPSPPALRRSNWLGCRTNRHSNGAT